LIVVELLAIGWLVSRDNTTPQTSTQSPTAQQQPTSKVPRLTTEIVLGGREHIWEIAFLPTKELIFTERKGTVSIIKNGQTTELAKIADVRAGGEGGLMGLAIDSKFNENRYLYTCFNSTAGDIRVVRWTATPALDALGQRSDIITGMPANPSGRHSGCRLAFGPDGFLWVGTGDTAQALTPQPPQDPKSLGGKILRVARDGRPASNNMAGNFDPRVYSYGHRNTQGIAFFDAVRGDGVLGVSSEHGTHVDDELNPLVQGNFGWSPPNGPYDESVPMTDKQRFPNAIEALWSSGNPTQAPSGVTIMSGTKWGIWNGAVAMAMLKDEHLKVLVLNNDLKVTSEEHLLQAAYGRLRAVTMGPDGGLYVGSSNGSDDKIIKVMPE
jgi:glucose/arabinose dehydrogenase